MVKFLESFWVLVWILAVVNLDPVQNRILKEGESCQIKTGGPGVCKLLSACGVYLEGLQNQTIEYSSIVRCSFKGQDEVICCPLKTTEEVLPKTFKGPEVVTEGPPEERIETPATAAKILKAGSICQTKSGEPGVCKLLSACGVYMEGLQKQTIEYSSIFICSFMGNDEVVCCPNNDLPTNHHVLGHIPTEPPRIPRPPFTRTTPSEIGRPNKILKSGAICQTKNGERGVCKLLSACGVYFEGLQKETIEYSSIIICSFIKNDEVVCCPHYEIPSNPQPTTEFIAPGPLTVTEGPIEQPAVPVLKAGSICKTKTDEPGICKLLKECGVYLEGLQKETIVYSSINICSFMGQDELVCCPGHIPTQTPKPGKRVGPFSSSENSSEVNRPAAAGSSKNIRRPTIWQMTKNGFNFLMENFQKTLAELKVIV